MASGTLSPSDVQEVFVVALKGDTDVANAVTDSITGAVDIREANWMGDEFNYPAIRVDNNDMALTEVNGNCFGDWFNINVSVFVFTEGRSSKACGDIMGLVGVLLANGVVSSAVLKSQPLTLSYIPPIPNGNNSWRGEVLVSGRINQL